MPFDIEKIYYKFETIKNFGILYYFFQFWSFINDWQTKLKNKRRGTLGDDFLFNPTKFHNNGQYLGSEISTRSSINLLKFVLWSIK